ncbi:hypothetical protein [Altererythrobacter sp. MF3-039]|uniref:hypothetical protein n=1 Tax=Altererythrobacter sp. MF3-039 TaxID=3252901 RepID=UPI00390CBD8C
MMALFFIAMQQVTVVTEIPKVPELTPAYLTKPIHQYSCRMIGKSGEPFDLVWQWIGQRGYYDGPIMEDGIRAVSRTSASAKLISDSSGLFSSMRFERLGGLRVLGWQFADGTGNRVTFRSSRPENFPKASLAAYYYEEGAVTPQVFAGPCDVIEIDQVPLQSPPDKSE